MKRKIYTLLIICFFSLNMMAVGKHYTVVISLDGFRWDYPSWYNTPFFDYMASHGVESGLIPSFPSKTFPNHYTLATGLYPDHHGLIANDFFDAQLDESFSLSSLKQKLDPRFYGGEPIWLTAQRQGLKTAVFYWPGSDVKINGQYPDTYYAYDKEPRLSFSERMEGIISQLKKPEKERPQLIMAYLSEPDHSGHNYGPHGKQTKKAVESVDQLISILYQKLQKLPFADEINLIVLSDHGMTWIAKDHTIGLMKYLKSTWVKNACGNSPTNIYAEKGCTDSIYEALRNVDHLRVWKKQDIPAYLHYGENARVGDIVASPDLGFVVIDDTIKAGGNHGFDPTMQDMHALFRAIGPDFKHISIPHFKNVDVYPLLCKLLGIQPSPNDGELNEIKAILK
ncbi:MAG: ectonucleotide pyrophosphatase/phosphodiesterase [Prevotella sp.]|jgi:predicted AlkP superfamily pyrophosphatase or phosphodiesterase|nr:ectonucleotide pyrophosphatase/phosphodiesterase [Prevotella sp.]MCI1281645.1 ectonucleotide pyrophosphatase/phosphodiesterase [Prevotella sp.]